MVILFIYTYFFLCSFFLYFFKAHFGFQFDSDTGLLGWGVPDVIRSLFLKVKCSVKGSFDENILSEC